MTRATRALRHGVVLLATATALAFALPSRAAASRCDHPTVARHGDDTARVALTGGPAVFTNHPGSIADTGGAVGVSTPLWLGTRWCAFQWKLDAVVVGGFGLDRDHAYVLAAPRFGFDLFLGSVFGFELAIGLGPTAQLGARTVGGAALTGRGAYVFRLADDDRHRVSLGITFWAGGYFAEDPSNDLGATAAAMSLAAGYETPL